MKANAFSIVGTDEVPDEPPGEISDPVPGSTLQ